MRRKDTDMTVYYANTDIPLAERFTKDILNIFSEVSHTEYEYLGAKIVIFPSIVGFLLTKFFGEQQNESKHIPEIILNSDKEIQAIFLRSIYDDEGSISIASNCILIKMTSRIVIEDCRKLLKNFDIKPGKIKFKDHQGTNEKRVYYFYLSGKPDLEKFKKHINFEHSVKSKQLIKLLSNYKMAGFKHGEARQQIFEQIQVGNGITVKELSKKLRMPPSAIRMHTRKLKNKNLIKTIKSNREEIFFKSGIQT